MTRDERAFFVLDHGTATTAVAIVGLLAGRWRLTGSLSLPSTADPGTMLTLLVDRLRATAPGIAAEIGADERAIDSWARLEVRTAAPRRMVVLAATARALAPYATVAEAAGWQTIPVTAEDHDSLAISRLLLEPGVTAVLAGSGDPAAPDERGVLGDLGAVVAAASTRRPELMVILAGAVAEQLPRFDAQAGTPGEGVVLGPPATAGDVPGEPLRELLEGLRVGTDDGRQAFVRAVASLSDAMDRRIEAFDVGHSSGTRVVAAPSVGGEPPSVAAMTVAGACLVPVPPDDAFIDRVLAWSITPLDRHRLRDRLTELALAPWGDAAGEGALLRLAVGRAALGRLLESTAAIEVRAEPDLIVVAGGAWAVAPGPAVALAVSDVLRRPGSRQVAYDHARLLGPLGAIEDEDERRRVLADLASDLLVPLGSVVMPQGLRPGRTAGQLVVHGSAGIVELDLVPGSLELIDLPPGETAVAELRFRETVRLGARGRRFAVELAGGLGGLLVDLRDIPMRLPERAEQRRELLGAWQDALWAGADS